MITIEMWMLLASLGLLFGLSSVQAMDSLFKFGMMQLVGTRENIPFPRPGFSGRIYRAIENLKENLLYFAPLVLLAAILGVSNTMTVIGAQLFFVGRVVHAGAYLAGVPWVRTFAFMAGVFGCVMIGLSIANLVQW